jgi:hypothetical protein
MVHIPGEIDDTFQIQEEQLPKECGPGMPNLLNKK